VKKIPAKFHPDHLKCLSLRLFFEAWLSQQEEEQQQQEQDE